MITRSKKELEKVFFKLEMAAGRYGLKINERKTKYLVMKQALPNQQQNCQFQSSTKAYNVEQVTSFEYLGVTISNNSEEDREIENRISKATKAMGSLKNIIRSKNISQAAKIRIYRTVIRPTAVYGCETWVLTNKNQTEVERWERKMLRAIFGGTRTEEGTWRRKTNREILDLYGHSTIIQYVKAQRLR